ncbi:MAG: tRNA (guanine(46)-N(7))-methyltransferase TrmB, partial [Acidimicrobiales bacterium]
DCLAGTVETSGPSPPGRPPGARTTKRRGRMPPGSMRALTEIAPSWGLGGVRPCVLRLLARAFGRQAPRLLDVGGGSGEASRAWANDRKDWDVVVVELHRPGMARLVRDLDAEGPPNLRVVEADVATVVEEELEPGSIHAVRILFPDPWPKRRHLDRRLVDDRFVARVVDLLPPGGWLHVATDWTAYGTQARAAMEAEPRLRPVTDDPGPVWTSPRPPRPVTAYERRGLDAGRTIVDLVAERVPA